MDLLEQFKALLNNLYVHALIWLVLTDVMTGYFKAVKLHNVNSSVGLYGLFKHITTIVIVTLLYPYLNLLGFSTIAHFLCIYFIVSYIISVLENAEALGVPFPKKLRSMFVKMRNEIDDKDIEDIATKNKK